MNERTAMKRFCIIPARGGSRRIPRKNIRSFFGKPIIAYSIELALSCQRFDAVYVSTEDAEIASVAIAYGATVVGRSLGMERDEATTQAVIQDAIHLLAVPPNDRVVCLYPCAPLLNDELLTLGIWQHHFVGGHFVASVGLEPFLHDAGAFYVGYAADWLVHPLYSCHTRIRPMPADRVCDINTPEDWTRAETMYAALQGKDQLTGSVH